MWYAHMEVAITTEVVNGVVCFVEIVLFANVDTVIVMCFDDVVASIVVLVNDVVCFAGQVFGRKQSGQ